MYTGIKNSKSVNGSYHHTGGSFFAHPYLQYNRQLIARVIMVGAVRAILFNI